MSDEAFAAAQPQPFDDWPTMTQRNLNDIGVEAYVYLYPLVIMDTTRRIGTNLPAGERPSYGPMNRFSHFRQFPDASFRGVVRPNFDTLYSPAWIDLTGGPVVLHAPDTGGRYYMLQLLDMWTDAFAVPGARTTGTAEADFVVVPPGWTGTPPTGMTVIEAPTPYVWLIGRTQTNGPGDYEAVHAVQDGFSITGLSGPLEQAPFVADPGVDMVTEPVRQVSAMTAEQFFPYGAALMKLHRPHLADFSQIARLAAVGIVPGRDLDFDGLPADQRAALSGAVAGGLDKIRALAISGGVEVVDGWIVHTEGIGTYGNAYLRRAAIAMGGLGANPAEDAVYPFLKTDSEGRAIVGERDYVLHFDAGRLPPAHAFWSLTMYDDEGFPIPNELGRYALGDRDKLVYGDDGSLDLYLRTTSPGPGLEPNWLPSAPGPLGLTMRLYEPDSAVLEGRWTPPPVTHVK